MFTNKEVNNEFIIKELCKYFSVNYRQFGNVWVDKMRWNRNLWNESDLLGWNHRICRDVTNMILSEPVKIETPNPNVNRLIETEIKGRLNFDAVLSKNLEHCMGIGDMVLSVYIDSLDNQPAINYIPGYNVIPVSFNNHNITELIWFTVTKLENETYVIVTLESLTGRKFFLFEYNATSLLLINYGSPLWTRIMGRIKPTYNYQEETPIKKFAWISTGLVNSRWIDTPFHNSFIWPEKYIKAIKDDWDLLQEEYSNSKKRLFVSPDVIKRTMDITDSNGRPIPIKKFDTKNTLFECVDLTEDQIKEWNPQVRFTEFITKIKFDLQCWGEAVGLGAEMYDFDRNGKTELTATQVLLSHRDAFNTINNIKYNLTNAIRVISYAFIDYWHTMGMLEDQDLIEVPTLNEITVHFDDGVFVNRAEKLQEGMSLYSLVAPDGSHIISKFDLLTKFGDCSESEANTIIARSQQELMEGIQLQMALSGATEQGESGEKAEEKEEE